MWIALLIVHGLLAFLLLGAITHQLVAVWAPARAKAGNFVGRVRAVPTTTYVNAVVVLYLITALRLSSSNRSTSGFDSGNRSAGQNLGFDRILS